MRSDCTGPAARQDDLIVEHVGDEILVYDLRTHRAYCLNRTAAALWSLCDGQTDPEEIRRRLEAELGSETAPEIVAYGLGPCRDRGCSSAIR